MVNMRNYFELFSDHPHFAEAEAEAALSAALAHAATLPNWDKARAYMQQVQTKYQAVGANDTEPRSHIVAALNNVFPDDQRDWWGRPLTEEQVRARREAREA